MRRAAVARVVAVAAAAVEVTAAGLFSKVLCSSVVFDFEHPVKHTAVSETAETSRIDIIFFILCPPVVC